MSNNDPSFPERREQLILHVITDREWSRGRSFMEIAEAAIKGGATVIQLRDKAADTRALIREGLELRKLTRQHGVLLIVNDRVDVALALDADGVHVGQSDMPGEIARKLIGPNKILGISAGTLEEGIAAVNAGADYLGVGPIFGTKSKADAGAPIGPYLLSELAKRYTTPLVAVGGVTIDNAGDLMRAGATGIAVITAVVNADDMTSATRRLANALDI